MPIARTLNQDFFKTWTPEMAYVLGYFAADGCMLRNSRGACYVEFTSTDRILLEVVQKAVGAGQRISVRPHDTEIWKTQYRIQVGCKEWFEDLQALGFTPRKSLTLQFPVVPDSCLGAFTRGYFDGDGCVYLGRSFAKDRSKKRIIFQTQFICGSEMFLQALWIRLKSMGIRGGHIHARNTGAYNLVFSWKDSLALYTLMYHTGQVADLFLPRKREKYEKAIRLLNLRS
jgi:hypothetical protein